MPFLSRQLVKTCRQTSRLQHRLMSSSSSSTKQTAKDQVQSLFKSPLVVVGVSLTTGFAVGRWSSLQQQQDQQRVLPSGLPRSCCEDNIQLTDEQKALPDQLSQIVGKKNMIQPSQSLPFLKGARLGGHGQALAIVTPTTLQQVVDCISLVVKVNCVVLPQGSNTGLTGGSVPRVNTGDHRPLVLISMKHLPQFVPLDQGKRVLCWAGAGLATLSREIPVLTGGRESHSILGSTFLNPTTAAGVAFGSGGTQLRKGPAYTDRALYIQVREGKKGPIVELVNTLGIDGMEDNSKVVSKLDAIQEDKDSSCPRLVSTKKGHGQAKASMTSYAPKLCQRNKQCSRYNANCEGLDCNRSEGKVFILATVHDTFAPPKQKKDYWISFKDMKTAYAFRKQVCLQSAKDLPVSLEYLDRDAFDVIDRSGRGQGILIKYLGPSAPSVKSMWNIKLFIESLSFVPYADVICDAFLHFTNPLFPPLLPPHIQKCGKAMDHHVSMTIGDYGEGNMEALLERLEKFQEQYQEKIVVHECTEHANALTAFRFVAASAFRTYCIGEGLQGVSIDYALPKNYEEMPKFASPHVKRMRYSHFGCNVVHEDIAFAPEYSADDVEHAKHDFKHYLEKSVAGKLPAEHGHGTEYHAPRATQQRWKRMDPLNVMNPGVGGLSYKYKYKE